MKDAVPAFQIRGRVKAVLIATEPNEISREVDKIQISPSWGVRHDVHGGSERLLDVRERPLTAHGLIKGMQIANHRQVSVTGVAETEAIRTALGLPGPIPPGLLGENLVVDGIDPLTTLPPGTLLLFQEARRRRPHGCHRRLGREHALRLARPDDSAPLRGGSFVP